MNPLQVATFGCCSVFQVAGRWGRCLLLMAVCSIHAVFAFDINQASEAELDSLKGMGPTLSAKVLKARAQAPFQTWQDLMQRVSGMGTVKAKQFSEQGLTVQGQAWERKP